ncbi:MAG: hypothetical protein EPO30_11410 [Lysobacteraceae bacterium]|nr:MAG: hypothetical protein EPO30_11410 [Xanthomonadaceae bacterium]
MTLSTIERAYQLARSGEAADVASLKKRLKADGCRAVDALLASRTLQGHLAAICAAAAGRPRETPASAQETIDDHEQ